MTLKISPPTATQPAYMVGFFSSLERKNHEFHHPVQVPRLR